MHFFRWVLYAATAAFIALLIASFFSTASFSTKKKNELSLGTAAEPSSLNPIMQLESASAEIMGFLFNGLLQYDENLELTGSLASSWSLSQITTFQCHTAAEAASLQELLEKEKNLHPEWGILSIAQKNDLSQVLVTLKEPGYEVSEVIAQKIPLTMLVPFPASKPEEETHPFLAEPIIEFTLRRDVRWHDGAPFTAHDVLFTYNAIMDERTASPMRSNFELVSKIETPDPWHVIVHYRRPFSPALNSWGTLILPAHLLEGTSPLTWGNFFNRHPIGTGPFRFDTWKNNEYIRLTRNPDYFLGSPHLDSIVFRVLPDPLTQRLAFETHQVDFWDAAPWAVKNFVNDPRYQLLNSPSNTYTYVGWNLKRPFFADRNVRQALAEAVNIQEIVDAILYGKGTPSTGIFTPRMWCFDPSIKPLPYDPKKAEALLDAAGWKRGPDGIRVHNGKRFSFTLITNNGSDIRRDIATLVQDDLKKIGIEVHVEIYEWTVFLKKVMQHDFDATVLAWALSNDCDQHHIWHSSQIGEGGFNYVGYNNPRVDELITKLRQEYTRSKQLQLAHELQQIIYQDQPYLFIYVPETTSILWSNTYRVCYPTDHGWVDSPLKSSKAGWSHNMEWFYRIAPQ